MKSSTNIQNQSNEYFHKISVVGGGITGAFMVLLLKKSKLFKVSEICWIKPKINISNDQRTTFFNQINLKLLNDLEVLKKIDRDNYALIKKIKVFGANNVSPLEWNYEDPEINLGAVIKNNIVLDSIEEHIRGVKIYDSSVSNTTCDIYERTLYLENKISIKTHLVISADGKNSYLRKLLSINTIDKNIKHVAISGFLRQSKNHDSTAIQAFTNLGPIGILPYGNKDIVNFVQSVKEEKGKEILSGKIPEKFICNELNRFFSNTNLFFNPILKKKEFVNKLSSWKLDLKVVMNPTSNRAILIGDAAHSIHPLAGQGLNLSFGDCFSVLNGIKKCTKFGNDLGDESILKLYKKERLPKTISMTAFTDFLFFGFTSNSKKTQTFLAKGMENLDKTSLKNIFRDIATQ